MSEEGQKGYGTSVVPGVPNASVFIQGIKQCPLWPDGLQKGAPFGLHYPSGCGSWKRVHKLDFSTFFNPLPEHLGAVCKLNNMHLTTFTIISIP
jgi:hypothetical protein